jgi:NTP pyrophosphatase (non-canonical NTP hydrolase)
MSNLAEAQRRVDQYIQANGGYWDPLSNLLRLVEEVGELSREFNHRYGAKRKKTTEDEKSLQDEFGDVLFVLLTTANALNIDLSVALESVITKYETRDKGRWTESNEKAVG